MPNRSIIYVDGLNLYYGAVKDGPYKWLDIQRLFGLLRTDDDIQQIYYFTAMIDGPRRPFQEAYLRALDTRPLVQIVLGRFKARDIKCLVPACGFTGSRRFKVTEEKRTNVGIAVQMLDDAYQDRCDRLVIVSGDSDLVPAVHRVKSRFPAKRVFVYVPSRNPVRGAAVELRSAADKNKTLPLVLLKRSQFPARIPDGTGGFIEKPGDW